MNPRNDIEAAADAYGEDALGPIYVTPLVTETDIELEDLKEREHEAQAHQEWVDSFRSWEREWWDREEINDAD